MTDHSKQTDMNEEAIRPAAMMVEKQECVDWDRNYLLERRSEWQYVNCPACHFTTHETYGEKAGFVYVSCAQCGTVYTNPRPSQELLHSFYVQSKNYAYWNKHIFPATEVTRRENIFRPRAEAIAEYCDKFGIHNGTLLEIGAAFGMFCEEIKLVGDFDRVVAVEPTAGLAETCRLRGLETLELPVEMIKEEGFADVVVAFEVLEHLFEPEVFIRQCQRLLNPGGLLVLTCPNVRGFDLEELRTLSGTFDHEHLNYFHPLSLKNLVSTCGLNVLEVATPGKLDAELVRSQVLAGHINLAHSPLLQKVLIKEWARLGPSFQTFLAENGLSSHMWVVAQKWQSNE